MTDDKCPSFSFPAVSRKKITAAFDGGLLTSNSGVMLLAPIERRMELARKIAALIADRRNPALVTHTAEDIFRARIFAIACGYPDGNDLDWLRYDPGFMLACGRLPASGEPLCSQPTISRWENAPTLRDIIRLTYLLVDIYCDSYSRPPRSVTFDIDDTVDVVHGRQRMSTYNGRPVTMILRPGKTPSGKEARAWLRRLVRRIRTHWPKTRIAIRGDGHYGRPEVMDFCENNGVDYFLGVSGNAVLDALVEEKADDIRVRRLDGAEGVESTLRGYAETQYQAKSWKKARRVCARIEATPKGLDIRYVATSRTDGSAEYVYEVFYCALTTLDRFGLVTWNDDVPMLRMLQVPELQRAMGFGSDFKLPHGTRRDRIKLLGNGVCPPVMKAVVRSWHGGNVSRAKPIELHHINQGQFCNIVIGTLQTPFRLLHCINVTSFEGAENASLRILSRINATSSCGR